MLNRVSAVVRGPALVAAVSGGGGEGGGGDPTGPALAALVAAAFGIRADAMWSVRRCSADISFARQVAMYLAHTRLGISLARTGRIFGRDRTTVRHACRRIEDRREDPRVDALLECLERALEVSFDLSLFPRKGAVGG
ncbi:MAG: chromosomal replication initiator DnaA [Bauldia sp.]|nr:chromosomal replication initiator DnaA [Bauldia sp.]